MASKKKSTGATTQDIPQEQVIEAQVNFAKGAQLACGHINKQYINPQGMREDLACTLLKGHEGDHFAKHLHRVTEYGIKKDEKGNSLQGPVGEHLEEAEAWWSDAAGEYPKASVITPEQDFQRLQEARARERGTDTKLSAQLDQEVRKSFGG